MGFLEFFKQSASHSATRFRALCSLFLAMAIGLGLESAARGDGRGDERGDGRGETLLASLSGESMSDLPALPALGHAAGSGEGAAAGAVSGARRPSSGTALAGEASSAGRGARASGWYRFPTAGTEWSWQSVLPGVDARLWHNPRQSRSSSSAASSGAAPSPTRLDGVFFPHVATRDRPMTTLRRSYQRLVLWSTEVDGSGRPSAIANVHCMGLQPEAIARRAARYDARLLELALEHNISVNLIKAIIATESCFNPDAVSHVGAVGLMQLMPDTARWLEADPHDIDANLRAGVRYFAQLRRRFGSTELALAAYNAGPGNVRRFNGIPPFTETLEYIDKVMAKHRRYRAAAAVASR